MIFFVILFALAPIAFYSFSLESELYQTTTILLFLISVMYSCYNLISMLIYLIESSNFLSIYIEKGVKTIIPILFLYFLDFYSPILENDFSTQLFHYIIVVFCFLLSFFILNLITFLFFKFTKFKSQNEIIEKMSTIEKEIKKTEDFLINDKESFLYILNQKDYKFRRFKNNEKFKQVFFKILKEEKKLNNFSMENE